MPLSGLISGAHQLGASLINYWSQENANDTNLFLARDQNMYNFQQWMRENQYNLPVNQVERLKQAGINPALAYANGSMMNEAAASPQMISGRVQAPYLSPVDLSQIRLNEALAGKADKEGQATEDANARANELQPYTVEQTKQMIDDLKQSISNLEEELKGIRLDNERKEIENIIASSTMQEAIKFKRLEAQMAQDEASYYVKSILAKLGVLASQKDLNDSSKGLNEANIASVNAMADLAKKYYDDAHERFLWEQFVFNANKKYVAANVHNDYVFKFYVARVGRKNAELLMKYGTPAQVLDLIRGGLDAVNSGIDAYKKLQPNISLGFSQKNGFGIGISNN